MFSNMAHLYLARVVFLDDTLRISKQAFATVLNQHGSSVPGGEDDVVINLGVVDIVERLLVQSVDPFGVRICLGCSGYHGLKSMAIHGAPPGARCD